MASRIPRRTSMSSSTRPTGCRTVSSSSPAAKPARASSRRIPCPTTKPPNCARWRRCLSKADAATVREHFVRIFPREPAVVTSAPGRVNLIGEHTDYNGGYVLPMAIPQRTWGAVAGQGDSRARASRRNLGAGDRVREFRIGAEAATRSWVDYVQGVTQALSRDGHTIGGFDLAIVSDVPLGSGLSSSAALEVAVLRGLRDLFRLSLNDVRLAQLGQRAENDFVGAPVGLMDQMAASLADDHTALFLDTRT